MEKQISIWDLERGKEYAAYDGERKLSKTYRLGRNGELENADELGHYSGCEWVPLLKNLHFKEITKQTKGEVMTSTTKKAKLPKVADLQAGNLLTMQEGVVYVADSGPLAGVRVTRVGGKIQRVRNMLGKEITDSKVDLSTTFKPVGKITLDAATV